MRVSHTFWGRRTNHLHEKKKRTITSPLSRKKEVLTESSHGGGEKADGSPTIFIEARQEGKKKEEGRDKGNLVRWE